MATQHLFFRRILSTIIDYVAMTSLTVILIEIIVQVPYNLFNAFFPGVTRPWPGLFSAHWLLMDSKPELETLFHPFYYGPFYSFLIVSLPLYILLVVSAPNSLGRKLMKIEVCYVNGSFCSTKLIRLRESIKWLWLFPMVWLVFGIVLANGGGLLKDLFASSIRFPLYYFFPFLVFMWTVTLGVRSIHDHACGTTIKSNSLQLSTGCSLLVATAFLLGFVSLCLLLAGSYSLSVLTWQNVGWDWDTQEERRRDLTGADALPYFGEPRFAFAMAVYSVVVFSWTYLVYRMRRRREAANGSQVNEEANEG